MSNTRRARGLSGNCAFCPYQGRLHREDAIPRWIGRSLHEHRPPKGHWEFTRVHEAKGEPRRVHTKRVGNASAVKLRVVCQQNCNGGWMSGLERAVQPILEPMMLDEAVTLGSDEQRVLGTWLTKTALVHELLELDRRRHLATDADRRRFGAHRVIPPQSIMRIGRYGGDFGAVLDFRRVIELVDAFRLGSRPEFYAQVFTVVLGSVVLQAIIPRQPPLAVWNPPVRREALTFWPSSLPLQWPPELSFTDATLDAFTKPGV